MKIAVNTSHRNRYFSLRVGQVDGVVVGIAVAMLRGGHGGHAGERVAGEEDLQRRFVITTTRARIRLSQASSRWFQATMKVGAPGMRATVGWVAGAVPLAVGMEKAGLRVGERPIPALPTPWTA